MPSTQDLVAPFDPTGRESMSGSELLQFLQGAFPAVDKGMVIITADIAGVPQVPDADTTPKWKRYVWLRVQATAVTLYVWNPGAASIAVYLQWQSVTAASIPNSGITNAMLAPGVVTDDKVSDVSYGKITGAPVTLPPGGAAGGDLTGNYPDPVIDANAVDSTKLSSSSTVDADRAVGNDHIKDGIIDIQAKIKVAGVWTAKQNVRVNDAATGLIAETKLITQIPEPTPVTDALKVVRVNAAVNAYEQVAPSGANGVGDLLQCLSKLVSASDSTATNIPVDNTIPQITEGKEYVSLAITPKSAASLLHIQFTAYMAASGATSTVLALFVDATANALKAIATKHGSSTDDKILTLDFWVASGSTAARTYRIRFGSDAGTAYINRLAAGDLFGGVCISHMSIREVVGTLS